jgi:hypothetical protein
MARAALIKPSFQAAACLEVPNPQLPRTMIALLRAVGLPFALGLLVVVVLLIIEFSF